MRGVCDTNSMQNGFRLPLRMLFYKHRTLALPFCALGRRVQHCALSSMQNVFRLRLEIRVHLFVFKAAPADQLLLSIPPCVYNMVS